MPNHIPDDFAVAVSDSAALRAATGNNIRLTLASGAELALSDDLPASRPARRVNGTSAPVRRQVKTVNHYYTWPTIGGMPGTAFTVVETRRLILLVEDAPDVGPLLEHVLLSAGHRVHLVASRAPGHQCRARDGSDGAPAPPAAPILAGGALNIGYSNSGGALQGSCVTSH